MTGQIKLIVERKSVNDTDFLPNSSTVRVENIALILKEEVISKYELMCNFVDNDDWMLDV